MINKTEVMTYAKEVLGNNAKGLFVDIGVVEESNDPLDYEVMTNLEEKIKANTYTTFDYRVKYGATKIVIIPNDRNYVIKIPFTGTYKTVRWNSEGKIPFEERNYEFVRDVENDVCDEENANYENSSPELREIISYNDFVGYWGTVPVYVQKKMEIGCDDVDEEDCAEGYRKTVVELAKRINEFGKDWGKAIHLGFICKLIDVYGYRTAEDICCEIFDTIPDFHHANYGFDKFGNCAIIDTAGYDISLFSGEHY